MEVHSFVDAGHVVSVEVSDRATAGRAWRIVWLRCQKKLR